MRPGELLLERAVSLSICQSARCANRQVPSLRGSIAHMKTLLLSIMAAAIVNLWCPGAYAGVAFLETSSGDGQWVVAASPSQLGHLIEQWTSNVSHRGGVQVRIRCEGQGWAASFYDNQTRSTGVSCGSDSRDEAERAAIRECRSRGGASCQRVFSGYDDATWTDREPGDGQYHLKNIQD